MFERAKQEFGGQVEVVCPGAGVYEPVRLAPSVSVTSPAPEQSALHYISMHITFLSRSYH